MNENVDDPSKARPELPDEADLTEQDLMYQAHTIDPVDKRVRHWHHWRTWGILCALAGIFMLIGGNFADSKLAMQLSALFILSGAILFVVGVIGGWVTRQRPLD